MLFVNGEELFKRGRNQNTLEPEHADALLNAYQAFHDEPGISPRRDSRRDRSATAGT